VYGDRTPHVHPPHCPTPHARSNPDWPSSLATSTSHATSPPLTSLHARPMVSARHPTLRQQEPNPPAPPQRARPRTAGMLSVTDAPAPSCVGSRRSRCSVEGGVQVEVEEGVSSQPARAERVPHSSLLAVLGWVCVYGVAGCTAASSRVDTGGSVHSGAAPLSGPPRAPMERQPSPLQVDAVRQCVHRWAARTRSTGTELLTPP
jgi:hypothetical protein